MYFKTRTMSFFIILLVPLIPFCFGIHSIMLLKPQWVVGKGGWWNVHMWQANEN